MSKIYVIAILALSSFTSLAQSDFIITDKGDTLTGNVYFDLKGRYGQDKIALKNSNGLDKYPPQEIESIWLKGEKFVAVTIGKREVFAKVLEEGTLGLYLLVDPNNIKRLDFEVKTLIKKGAKPLEITATAFKSRFKKLVSECDDVTSSVDSKTFSKSKIADIVQQYNECADNIKEQNLIDEIGLTDINEAKAFSFQSLVSKVNNSNLSNKGEINEMLSDVIKRISNKESIPGYLKNAVLSSFDEHDDWKDMFLTLIKE